MGWALAAGVMGFVLVCLVPAIYKEIEICNKNSPKPIFTNLSLSEM